MMLSHTVRGLRRCAHKVQHPTVTRRFATHEGNAGNVGGNGDGGGFSLVGVVLGSIVAGGLGTVAYKWQTDPNFGENATSVINKIKGSVPSTSLSAEKPKSASAQKFTGHPERPLIEEDTRKTNNNLPTLASTTHTNTPQEAVDTVVVEVVPDDDSGSRNLPDTSTVLSPTTEKHEPDNVASSNFVVILPETENMPIVVATEEVPPEKHHEATTSPLHTEAPSVSVATFSVSTEESSASNFSGVSPTERSSVAVESASHVTEEAKEKEASEVSREASKETLVVDPAREDLSKLQSVVESQAGKLEDMQKRIDDLLKQLESSSTAQQSDRHHEQRAFRDMLSMQEQAYQARLEELLSIARGDTEKKLLQERQSAELYYADLLQNELQKEQANLHKKFEERHAASEKDILSLYQQRLYEDEVHFEHRLIAEMDALETQVTEKLISMEGVVEHAHRRRQEEIAAMEKQVEQLNRAYTEYNIQLTNNSKLQAISVALFGLGNTVYAPSQKPFVSDLRNLKLAAGNNTIIDTLTRPLEGLAYEGVPSYTQLVTRFKSVAQSGRQAALIPEDAGFVSNVVAAVASKFIIPEKGMVEGESAEALFAKAEYFLEQGDLRSAVAHVEKLHGKPALLARDWVGAAKERLVAEQSLIALQAHVASLLHVDTPNVVA